MNSLDEVSEAQTCGSWLEPDTATGRLSYFSEWGRRRVLKGWPHGPLTCCVAA